MRGYLREFACDAIFHACNSNYQYRIGLLDDGPWEVQQSNAEGPFVRHPQCISVVEAQARRSPEFVALVEEILGEEPERAEVPR